MKKYAILLYNKIGGNMTILMIINYNDYKNTKRLIENVYTFKSIDQVIVIDNNSSDDSYNKLKKLKLDFDLVETNDNKGYSYAINFGIKYILKHYKNADIFISNSDIIIPTEDTVLKLLKNLTKEVAIVGPVVNEHGNLNRGWKMPSPFIDALMNLPLIHNFIRKKFIFYKDSYYDTPITTVDMVSGCFFLINAKTLEKIDYLDENIFLFYEENILAKKLKSINKKEVVVNDAFIIHDHSVSIDNNIKKIKKFKILKNSQYYFQTKYNNANFLEKFLLKFNKNIALGIYHIASFFKGGK